MAHGSLVLILSSDGGGNHEGESTNPYGIEFLVFNY